MLGLTAISVRTGTRGAAPRLPRRHGNFPFGSCTADILIQIHGSGANRLPPHQLPQSWATLRELAREAMSLEDGFVRLTQRDAEVPETTAPETTAPPETGEGGSA